jgi:purine-binding chemotaxis protein CheW
MAKQLKYRNNGPKCCRPGRETPYLLIGSGRILKVREIIEMMRITPIPGSPEYVKGIINLREEAIPVIDLKIRFGMASVSHTERTCIVVVEIDSAAGRLHIGVVVDSVSEVINKKEEENPAFSTINDTDYIPETEREAGSAKILMDVDKVLSNNELNILDQVA